MIDWLTASVPFEWEKPVNGGQFICVKPDGEIEYQVHRRKMLEGSFSSKVAIRTVKRGFVEVSGNPSKFLQGHNVFGTDDLCYLTYLFMRRVSEMVGMPQSPEVQRLWLDGDFDISRLDINYMFPLRDRSEVRAWLRAAQETTRVKWRGRGQCEDGTLYFGKAKKGGRASPWSMKLYCKGDELGLRDVPLNADDWEDARSVKVVDLRPSFLGEERKPWSPDRVDPKPFDSGWGGKLPPDLPFRDRICQWADNKLRIELTLRSQEMKRMGLLRANMWSLNVVREVYSVYLSKLEIGEQVMTAVDDVERLPRSLRRTYNEWKLGVDLRQELPKVTFWRHRKQILDAVGVDIGVLQPKSATVIPLRRSIVLGAAAEVPDWAPPSILVRAA